MIKRFVMVVIAICVLVWLIAYSQFRPTAPRVSGFIEADEIRLGSRVGGRVAKVHVEEGQRVEPGRVLVELEPFDLQEREQEAIRTLAGREADYQRLLKGLRPEEIAQAKAHFDQLQAQLELLRAGPRPQELEAARARLRAAQAELRLAEQLYERHAALVQSGAITEEEFERTIQAFVSAGATVTVREEELEVLELGTREEEIQAARAAVEAARAAWEMAVSGFRQEEIDQARATRDATQAALEAIRRQQEELEIRSPLQGLVESLDLQPGDMVAPGAPVLSLLDDRRLWVRAYVPQSYAALRVGQQLRVTVDGFQESVFQGTVSFISDQAEFTPSNVQTPEERAKQVFRIKVSLQAGAELLRPGMTADVWLDGSGED